MSLNTFPADILPIKMEIQLSGTTWTDITSRMRLKDKVTIRGRGRQNEISRGGVSEAYFTLNNRDGLFSEDNPVGSYWGQLGQNLPVRVSVTEPETHLDMVSDPDSVAYVNDNATISVTGDMEVRIEFEIDHVIGNGYTSVLASKYNNTGNQRSWILMLNKYGYLVFWWSTTGANNIAATSTVPIAQKIGETNGRIAVSVTLDVDNGSGGTAIKFYTATSIADNDFVQLGSGLTYPAVTNVFDSTARLQVGRVNGNVFNDVRYYVGRFYRMQLFNGIAGTKVADANFTVQTPGAGSFGDAHGNTWVINESTLSNSNYRFHGEISQLPQYWDESGRDVWVPVVASDIRRRLEQGTTPVESALTRYFGGMELQGHWPGEDGLDSTSLANLKADTTPGQIGGISFSEESDFPASAGAFTFDDVNSRVYARTYNSTPTGYWFMNLAFKFPSVPAGSVTLYDGYVSSSTKISRVNVSVTSTTYVVAIYDGDNTLIGSQSTAFGTGNSPDQWTFLRLQLWPKPGSPSDTQIDLGWYSPGQTVLTGAPALTVTATTPGRMYAWRTVAVTNSVGLKMSQVAYGQFYLDNTLASYVQAANAFNGETTSARFVRLMEQQGITYDVIGDTTYCEQMGPQFPREITSLIDEIVDLEDAVIQPARSFLGLTFRSRRSQQNQYGPILNYRSPVNEISGEIRPVRDDTLIRNKITVVRTNGSSYTAEKTSGRYSTAPFPAGVGEYFDQITLNVYDEERLPVLAQFAIAKGTVNAQRISVAQVDLQRAPYFGGYTQAKRWRALMMAKLDVGDKISFANLPIWVTNLLQIDSLIRGYEEVLENRGWRFRWNTSPYEPYYAIDFYNTGVSKRRIAATTSVTNASVTSTATSFDVATPTTSAPWIVTGVTAADRFPVLVMMGGELISVGAIGARVAGVQSFSSVTRSVNGVVKSHSSNVPVQVYEPILVGI